MQRLSELFATTAASCQQFVELLDAEKKALLEQDISALQSVVDAKAPLIDALKALEADIVSQLEVLGKPSSMSPSDFIHTLNNNELTDQHTTLLGIMQTCQEANLRNARLIHQSQHINRTALDMLRNQGETGLNMYDRLGNTSRTSTGRPISRA